MTDEMPEVWPTATDAERKRGFLTQRDREYILGELEIDGQPERDLRYRIRQRVENGLLDAAILQAYPDDELEKVLTNNEYPSDNLVVLLYSLAYRILLLSYNSGMIASYGFDDFDDLLADMFKHSIDRVERPRDGVTEVDIDLEIDRSEVDEDLLLNRIVGGRATVEELWTYVESGDVGRLVDQLEAEGQEDAIAVKMDFLREIAAEQEDN